MEHNDVIAFDPKNRIHEYINIEEKLSLARCFFPTDLETTWKPSEVTNFMDAAFSKHIDEWRDLARSNVVAA